MNTRKTTSFIFICFFALILLIQCTKESERNAPNGEKLANQYCGNCHLVPKPDELTKTIWKDYVLPRMGYMHGIYPQPEIRDSLIEAGVAGEIVRKMNIYPADPIIAQKDWKKIVKYYIKNAPSKYSFSEANPLEPQLPLFDTKFPDIFLSPPSITLCKINTNGGFFVGDANAKAVYQFSKSSQFLNAAKVREGAVHLEELANSFLITIMGSFSPTDAPTGLLMALPKDKSVEPSVLIGNLQRPVHNAIGDFDRNGQPEFVISEFAKWTGRLSLWQPVNGNYQATTLKKQPGAIRSVILDFNQDQKEDILTLFGQGAEGIYAFYQQEDGSFQEKALIQFPATYGSSYFDLQDLDNDNDLDIIYTNGDNADYRPVTKPFHGIRIFTNNGQGQFQESFFYPLPGAYKAIPRDFDQDGDLDIAAISFFPDFEQHPEQSFVYLENQGAGNYLSRTFPQANKGRWITMDAGDIDQDGDEDLLLGSLAFEVIPRTGILQDWIKDGIPFVVLENNLK